MGVRQGHPVVCDDYKPLKQSLYWDSSRSFLQGELDDPVADALYFA